MRAEYLFIKDLHLAFYQGPRTGRPILFLPGRSLSSQIFQTQFAGKLTRDYSLFSFDLPGHGLSAWPEDPAETYTLPSLAALVWETMLALNIPDAVLVGHSFGGHLALEIAATFPVAGLFLFGTPPLGKSAGMAKAFLSHPAARLLNKPDLNPAELQELAGALVNKPDANQLNLLIQVLQQSDPASRPALGSIVLSGNYADELEVTRQLRVPISLLQGAREPFINLAYLQELTIPRLWDQEIKIIPQAGHTPCLEQPAFFNELLGSFMQENF